MTEPDFELVCAHNWGPEVEGSYYDHKMELLHMRVRFCHLCQHRWVLTQPQPEVVIAYARKK